MLLISEFFNLQTHIAISVQSFPGDLRRSKYPPCTAIITTKPYIPIPSTKGRLYEPKGNHAELITQMTIQHSLLSGNMFCLSLQHPYIFVSLLSNPCLFLLFLRSFILFYIDKLHQLSRCTCKSISYNHKQLSRIILQGTRLRIRCCMDQLKK